MHPAKAIALILGLMIVLLLGVVIGVVVERTVGGDDGKPVAATPGAPVDAPSKVADAGIVFGTRDVAIGKQARVQGVVSGPDWLGIHILETVGGREQTSVIIIDPVTGKERGRLRVVSDE